MKNLLLIFIATIGIAFFTGCEKSTEDSSPEITNGVTGLYSGTWIVTGTGQAAGTCEVIRASANSVNLRSTVAGQSIPTIPGVKLRESGNGKFTLSYTDAGGSLTGTIENKTLTLFLTAGNIEEHFTGSRP